MDNNEKFKLNTRRLVTLGMGSVAVLPLSFVVIYRLIFDEGCKDMAMAALGGLIAITVVVTNFYLGRKVKEE